MWQSPVSRYPILCSPPYQTHVSLSIFSLTVHLFRYNRILLYLNGCTARQNVALNLASEPGACPEGQLQMYPVRTEVYEHRYEDNCFVIIAASPLQPKQLACKVELLCLVGRKPNPTLVALGGGIDRPSSDRR